MIEKDIILRLISIVRAEWWIIYTLLLLVISHLNILNDVYIAFLATPLVILVPVAVGKAVFYLLQITIKKLKIDHNPVCRLFFLWSTGVVAIFFITLLSASFPFWNFRLYIFTLLLLVFGINSIKASHDYKALIPEGSSWSTILGDKRVLLPLSAIGFLSALQVKLIQPFPLTQNPLYNLVLFSLSIIDGNTFYVRAGNAHMTSLLASIPAVLGDVHPLLMFHSLPYLLHLLYPIAVYLLTYCYTKKIPVSLFASILATSLTINSLNNFSGGPLLYFLFPLGIYFFKNSNLVTSKSKNSNLVTSKSKPKNILLFIPFIPIMLVNLFLAQKGSFFMRNLAVFIMLFVLLLVIILLKIKQNESLKVFLLMSPIMLSVMFLHEYNALFWLLIVIVSTVVSAQAIESPRRFGLIYLFIVLSFMFISMQLLDIIKFPDNFMFSRVLFGDAYNGFWFDQDAHSKFNWLQNSINIFILYLSIIGCLVNPLVLKREVVAPSVLQATTLLLLFLPEGHLWRVRPYIGLFAVMNVSILLMHVPLYFLYQKTKLKFTSVFSVSKSTITRSSNYKSKLLAVIGVLILLISAYILVPIAVQPRLNFSQSQVSANNEGNFSQLLSYEVDLAFWIYDNTPQEWVKSFWWEGVTLGGTTGQVAQSKQTLIVSDPYTMFMLEGLTGRSQVIDKRVWVDERKYPLESVELMRRLKEEVFMANSSTAYKNLIGLKGEFSTVLVVVTERTSAWINRDKMFIRYPPSKFDKKALAPFNNTLYFKLVYYIPNKAYVFQMIPNAPINSDNY